jgi:hypothetical protein
MLLFPYGIWTVKTFEFSIIAGEADNSPIQNDPKEKL